MSDPEKIAADIATMKADIGWIKENLISRTILCARHVERTDEIERTVADMKGSWKTALSVATGGGIGGGLIGYIVSLIRH